MLLRLRPRGGGAGRCVTNLSSLVIIALLLLVVTWWVLWRTSFGLRLRSCGESPSAAESLGVAVLRYKFVAVLISGGLAGLAGGFLAMVAASNYRDGQTGGRGYIGLAAMIFGNWRPGGLLAGSGLFGYTQTLSLRQGDSLKALLLAGRRARGRGGLPPGPAREQGVRRRHGRDRSSCSASRTSRSTRCPTTSPR